MSDRTTSVFSAGFLFLLLFLMAPSRLLAIHAIFKGAEPIPRHHGPVKLNMVMADFLRDAKGTEVSAAIGQFSDEHRFELDRSLFQKEVTQVLSDFYKDRLFRIEINYRAMSGKHPRIQNIIDRNSKLYGSPRINSFAGIDLLFWDDGATRLIMEVDENDGSVSYSLTYIDDDLFHQASRDRVQRETAGQSSYGK